MQDNFREGRDHTFKREALFIEGGGKRASIKDLEKFHMREKGRRQDKKKEEEVLSLWCFASFSLKIKEENLNLRNVSITGYQFTHTKKALHDRKKESNIQKRRNSLQTIS